MKKLICIAFILTVISGCFTAVAEDKQVFIFCNPKTSVNIRKSPRKGGEVSGRLDFGDWVQTDEKKKNGFLHVYGVTEDGEGWIFAGYAIDDEPVKMNRAWATVAANGRVMSYRWVKGRSNKYLDIGTDVKVLAWSEDWAVTDHGYIRTKYLEVWYE